MRYFAKELFSNAVQTDRGSAIRFTECADDVGVIQLEDAYLIDQCEKLIAKHRGGIREITAEEYDELVKKKPVPRPQGGLRLLDPGSARARSFVPPSSLPKASPAAVVADSPPAPVEVPKSFTKPGSPKVGKPRKVIAAPTQ